jgi:hypothetical protein
MNDGARAKEQQGFEKRMGEQMEDGNRIGTDAQGKEHIAQLAAGGIGDHPFDIVLHQTDCGCEKCREAANNGNHHQGGGGVLLY